MAERPVPARPTTAASPFRVYSLEECGKDGYPLVWHETIKHEVRAQAGHRCIRCHHPYFIKHEGNVTSTAGHQRILPSTGEYVQVSRCDDECRHGGPVIYWTPRTGWGDYDGPDASIANEVYAVWRVLTVHHLNGVKADCRWWNLVSLCQRCHLRVQRVVLMERVWPWEHSEWFRPYVAGYYAHVYLGEDLTREEAEVRLDELLALERAA